MKTTLTCFFILIALSAYSQTMIERVYLCKYNFTYQRDSSNKEKMRDLMVLDIGKGFSRYYSELRHTGVKQVADDVKSKSVGNVINLGEVSTNNYTHYDKETEVIYNIFSQKRLKVFDAFGRKPSFYYDTISIPAWDIKEDTITILNQLCQKATCSFKGRNYIAWFAPSIPIQLGPWQFNGLPGLILKISDEKSQFIWECFELTTKPTSEPVYTEYENATETTKHKTRERKKLFLTEPLAFDQLEWGVTMTFDNKSVQPKKPKPYNPIDLTY